MEDNQIVKALVPIYTGNNILDEGIEELAKKVLDSEGKVGRCQDYVINIQASLNSLGIDDPEVSQMANIVNQINNQ